MTYLKIGLIINPIAGIGAEFAWKGTDDIDLAWKKINEGTKQQIFNLVHRAIQSIPSTMKIKWILGYDTNEIFGSIVYQLPIPSYAHHTHDAVKVVISHKVDLLLFAGGDGTAIDVAKYSGKTPILGIPGGVKIFSPCFLHHPEDLGLFLRGWRGESKEVDLFDLDEELYRKGRAIPKLVGSCLIPISNRIQNSKVSFTNDDFDTFRLIAERIMDEAWLVNKRIIVGPGSTMKRIFQQLGLNISLLGVDIVHNGDVFKTDCTSKELSKYDFDEVWLSPIGNQGHIFGRGNKQITSSIICHIGKNNIRIFATPEKMQDTPLLFADTGDSKLDDELMGYYSVIVGYYEEILCKIK